MHASQRPLNQQVWISMRGMCFWDCQSMHVQRSVKSVRRVKRTYYVERVSRMWAQFRTVPNARIWLFFKTTTRFICFARHCCSLILIVLDADFMALWVHLCCLSSLPFSRQASSSFGWLRTFLKRNGCQSHTPPTENTHCKISSLRQGALQQYISCYSHVHILTIA